MKFAFISDIHGNLEALEEVLKDIEIEKPDEIYVLGDIIGYMSNPKECIDLIQNFTCIQGNHENALFNQAEFNTLKEIPKKSLMWTKEQLDYIDITFLKRLPLTVINKEFNFQCVHGSLEKNNPFRYLEEEKYVKKCFEELKFNILFVGHSHIPKIWEKTKKIRHGKRFVKDGTVIFLEKEKKYIINVGSVGLPRDRIQKGCYVIYDTKENSIKINRFNYDRFKTIEKIKNSSLNKDTNLCKELVKRI